MTELVKWTSNAAVLIDFAIIFGPMYLLHSLQVAIVTGKSKKHMLLTEFVKWNSSAAVFLDFANIFGPMYLLHLLQVCYSNGKVKETRCY